MRAAPILLVLGLLRSEAHADVGAMVGAGVPSGASASLVYRTSGMVRVHAGGAHNLVGPGVQAGVTLAPGRGPATPVLAVEAGRFFARDSNAAVERIAGAPSALAPEQLGYDFASAHLGLELGSSRARFYLHAGVSYLDAAWRSNDTDDGVTTMTTGVARGFAASARLGLLFYL